MYGKTLPVPTSNDYIFAVLDWASRRGEFERREAVDSMVAHFNLSDEAQMERTANGHALRHENRTMRAISNLKNAGFIAWKAPGRYEITDLGRRELATSGGKLTHGYLRERMS